MKKHTRTKPTDDTWEALNRATNNYDRKKTVILPDTENYMLLNQNRVSYPQRVCNTIDIAEWQLDQIKTDMGNRDAGGYSAGKRSGGAHEESHKVSRMQTPAEDRYFLFDSRYRIATSNLPGGEIDFDVTAQNNNTALQNVIAMQIFSFTVPNPTAVANAPDFYFYTELFVTVLGLQVVQSISAPNNNLLHFVLELDSTVPPALTFRPKNNKGFFFFSQPLISIDTLKLSLSVPPFMSTVPLPKDVATVQATPGTNPAVFTFTTTGDDVSILGVDPTTVPATTQVAVYFTGFSSPSQTINASVNRTSGWMVTAEPTSTTFSVTGLDLTALAATTACNVLIAKNRIELVCRFIVLNEKSNNDLVSVRV